MGSVAGYEGRQGAVHAGEPRQTRPPQLPQSKQANPCGPPFQTMGRTMVQADPFSFPINNNKQANKQARKPQRLTLPDDGQDDAGGGVEQQHAQPHAAQRGAREQQPAAGGGGWGGEGAGVRTAGWGRQVGVGSEPAAVAAHAHAGRRQQPFSCCMLRGNDPLPKRQGFAALARPPAHAKQRHHEEVHDQHRGARVQPRQQRHRARCGEEEREGGRWGAAGGGGELVPAGRAMQAGVALRRREEADGWRQAPACAAARAAPTASRRRGNWGKQAAGRLLVAPQRSAPQHPPLYTPPSAR